LVVISPAKPKIDSLSYSLGFLAQLTRVCEKSKIMMNIIMMEDKLGGSSKLNSWKPILQGDEDINISTLSGMVPTNDNTWLIDSGASRHMTGFRDHLTNFVEKETHLHVVLGDDARYNVKGVGNSSFQLDSDMQLQLRELLYVPGVKRNLVSIFSLEDKGYKVTFSEGRVIAWHKDSHINSAKVIGVRENNMYILTINPVKVLLHDTINLSEL
jgi:hypothetical protein